MIVVKAIEPLSVIVNVGSSNNIPFINFGFEVFDNFNTETAAYDSRNYYQAKCSLNQFSYNESINVKDEIYEGVSVTLGNTTFNFFGGEYQDLNGTPYDISAVSNAIGSALGA